MRWESLFDDLESQLEHELDAEQAQLTAEEERLRLGRLSLRARLSALAAGPEGAPGFGDASGVLRIELRSGALVSVRAITFGKDWFAGELVAAGVRRPQCVIPFTAIGGVLLDHGGVERSLREQPSAPAHLAERIGLAFVLRDLCRRRAAVELDCGTNGAGVARVLHGTIDRVGRDHCDLAMHEAGAPRRSALVSGYRIVPFDQLMMVRVTA
jgi:hypothetical protein